MSGWRDEGYATGCGFLIGATLGVFVGSAACGMIWALWICR